MACLGAAGPATALAADRTYEEAVVATRGLVKEALNGATGRIPDAIATLENGTGSSQPEILADLRRTPPDLHDADVRLAAVEAALNRPGDGGDPAAARQDVHGIIALPRYDGMRGGLSIWDRFLAWFFQTLAYLFLNLVINNGLPAWLPRVLAGGLMLVVLAAIFIVARGNWMRGAAPATATPEEVRSAVRDRFAAADRLAAAGDLAGGLRELVAAVSGNVGNRPFWETSPLTVRELFRENGVLDELRPLLAPFEASAYGRRTVSPDEFRAALAAAARFRDTEARAAA